MRLGGRSAGLFLLLLGPAAFCQVVPVPVRSLAPAPGAQAGVVGALFPALGSPQVGPAPASLSASLQGSLVLPSPAIPQVAAAPSIRAEAALPSAGALRPAAAVQPMAAAALGDPIGPSAVPAVRGVPAAAAVSPGPVGTPLLAPEPGAGARKQLRIAAQAVEAAGRGLRLPQGRRTDPGTLARVFDNSGRAPAAPVRAPPRAEPPSGSSSPKAPRGVKSVSVDIARTPSDVSRLIPESHNSVGLIAMLKRKIRRHPEGLAIRTYTDPLGARFVGLDLSRSPAWLDDIPELEQHERELIRKILDRTPDVQVLVREEGKTPDLVVDVVITELKSVFAGGSLVHLVNKADRQVDEFTHRHVLSGGDAAVDLREEDSVPVEDIQERLNAWAQRVRVVTLDRVWVHAGRDVKVFRRVGNRFELYDPSAPGDAGGRSRPLGRSELARAQALMKEGRLHSAQRLLDDVVRLGEPSAAADAARARESLEAARAVLKIRKLAQRQGLPEPAAGLWAHFQESHPPEAVAEVSSEVDRILAGSR